jgi:hypothetical protein
VAGALLGICVGEPCGDSADIATQSSHDTAQSQMSPSEYDSSIEVPVTSTGSP